MALPNVTIELAARDFLLFGLPPVRVRADLVELEALSMDGSGAEGAGEATSRAPTSSKRSGASRQRSR